MTNEERLQKPCPRKHPLSGRYIERRGDGEHPNGSLACRFCDMVKRRKREEVFRRQLPPHILHSFPDKLIAGKQIASLLHIRLCLVMRWLNSARCEQTWRIKQIVAAVELGLISRCGLPPDPQIPFDPEIDVEPQVIVAQRASVRLGGAL